MFENFLDNMHLIWVVHIPIVSFDTLSDNTIFGTKNITILNFVRTKNATIFSHFEVHNSTIACDQTNFVFVFCN